MTVVQNETGLSLTEPPVVHEIADIIRNNDEFLIAGHLRPDGDCLGSCLGLLQIIENMGKSARFFTPGPLPDFFKYLENFCRIETEIPTKYPRTILYVDSAEQERVHELFKPQGFIVNIDHHLSNTRYGNVNWVDVDATAAGEQIYRLAMVLEQPITREIATCLYTALMTDTGGFRYSNTDQMTFQAAAHLVRAGANPASIAEYVFDSRKPEAVKLQGEVYSSLRYEFGGKFVWNEITMDLLSRVGGEQAEPEGLASDIRGIDGVEIAVLFFETPDNYCRIGFRSKGKINVSELAQLMGGGGHHNASGALIRDNYTASRDTALETIRAYLNGRI